MRPSYEALPTWLGRVSELAPTPVRAGLPPEEGRLQRLLRNPLLPLHIALFAIGLGIGAAAAAGSVRARYAAEVRAEMSAHATRKVGELRAFGMLRSVKGRALAVGGSVVEDVPGYFDEVEATNGRRFRRRWLVEAGPAGQRRVVVRVLSSSTESGRDSVDLAAVLTER